MPLNETSGNVTTDAFGGGVAAVTNYIEDVFSTYLYDGTGSALTITNNIDLSTKGGMVWLKSRSNVNYHYLNDTARGAQKSIYSNTNDAQAASPDDTVTAFNSNGFTLGTAGGINTSARTYASWTFRKQPKFFDVVTFSGNGGTQNIAHNLGSVPGCVIVKFLSGSAGVGNWPTWHRGLSSGRIVNLNLTGGQGGPFPTYFGDNTITVNPTSTQFTVGSNANVNESGSSYVAYVFAHDAGGFGLTGTDNVISCGSFTVSGNVASVNLGYEPQWLLIKKSSATGYWVIKDVMRGGLGATSSGAGTLYVNENDPESSSGNWEEYITSTGFGVTNMVDETYIYIAIRRGPMKVPTVGTSVFYPKSSWQAGTLFNIGFTADMAIFSRKDGDNSSQNYPAMTSRLMDPKVLITSDTTAQVTQTGLIYYTNGPTNYFGQGLLGPGGPNGPTGWAFGRAPGFCDVVCYTGTGSNTTITHNLGAVPELMIVKRRDTTADWDSYCSALANTEYVVLNTTAAKATGATRWNSTTPTSSVFSVGTSTTTNASAGTYVAYLFATCAGVSKVGSYTGNGTTQTIDCGLTAGARFVLIKRTDSTGDWYVYDTARGMTTLTDPYLLLNSTAAEVASLGSVTTVATGFALNSSILAAINVNTGTYIFLAIA